MSVRSLAVLAESRDRGTPSKPKRKSTAAAGSITDAAGGETSATALDALVTAIPTEPLALYTGLVSGILALFDNRASLATEYLPLRWWIFVVAAVVVAAWVTAGYWTAAGGHKRRLPLPEAFTATAAFVAWALVMPGSPLLAGLTGDTGTIVTLCITFGGATLVYLMAQFGLTRPSRKSAVQQT